MDEVKSKSAKIPEVRLNPSGSERMDEEARSMRHQPLSAAQARQNVGKNGAAILNCGGGWRKLVPAFVGVVNRRGQMDQRSELDP